MAGLAYKVYLQMLHTEKYELDGWSDEWDDSELLSAWNPERDPTWPQTLERIIDMVNQHRKEELHAWFAPVTGRGTLDFDPKEEKKANFKHQPLLAVDFINQCVGNLDGQTQMKLEFPHAFDLLPTNLDHFTDHGCSARAYLAGSMLLFLFACASTSSLSLLPGHQQAMDYARAAGGEPDKVAKKKLVELVSSRACSRNTVQYAHSALINVSSIGIGIRSRSVCGAFSVGHVFSWSVPSLIISTMNSNLFE
jgi:hypothetical protein